MVGLRQKKKEITRKRILEVSKELFMEQGYDITTSEQIAEKAGLGTGTVYNYFKSKADIFIATMTDEFGLDKDYDIQSIDNLNKGVAEIVNNYINKYIKKFKIFSKKLMRELISAALGSFKSNPEFLNKLIKLDYKFMENILELLNDLKKKGALREEFDTNECVELIYSAMIFEISLFVYREEVSLNECMDRINKKINFIFRQP